MKPLPFAPGEELVYRTSIPRFGGGGQGTMRVTGPEVVRGRSTWLLEFHFSGRVAIASISDHTRSWFDPERMTALRFGKRERSPISSIDVEVELYPEERRWTSKGGAEESGESLTPTLLDELSYLYYVRTLPLEDGERYTSEHHFDAGRNPVVVHASGRETVTVPAGTFDTVVAEMLVHNPSRFGGSGRVLMHLTDDARRMPVRIETAVPVAGSMILALESWTEGALSEE